MQVRRVAAPIRRLFGSVLFVVLLPFLLIMSQFNRRHPREYGLKPEDRVFEITRKFGKESLQQMLASLSAVEQPQENVLGAIVFLANDAEQFASLVKMANSDRNGLLRAATVKDERG